MTFLFRMFIEKLLERHHGTLMGPTLVGVLVWLAVILLEDVWSSKMSWLSSDGIPTCSTANAGIRLRILGVKVCNGCFRTPYSMVAAFK